MTPTKPPFGGTPVERIHDAIKGQDRRCRVHPQRTCDIGRRACDGNPLLALAEQDAELLRQYDDAVGRRLLLGQPGEQCGGITTSSSMFGLPSVRR
jgi:hypothetical protein